MHDIPSPFSSLFPFAITSHASRATPIEYTQSILPLRSHAYNTYARLDSTRLQMLFLFNLYNTSTHIPPPWQGRRLEGVVLRRNLDVKVVAQNGDLLHDVVAHAGHLGEEEEGEDAGNAAEAGCEGAAGRWG